MARGCLQFTHSGSQTMMHPKIPSRSTRARCPVSRRSPRAASFRLAAILAIAPKIGCNPETLRAWYRKHQDMQNPTLVAKQAQDARIKARRSAYLSLKRNLDYLFTFEAPPELGMCNTTNLLDGCFADLKRKLGCHHGMKRENKLRFIKDYFAMSDGG